MISASLRNYFTLSKQNIIVKIKKQKQKPQIIWDNNFVIFCCVWLFVYHLHSSCSGPSGPALSTPWTIMIQWMMQFHHAECTTKETGHLQQQCKGTSCWDFILNLWWRWVTVKARVKLHHRSRGVIASPWSKPLRESSVDKSLLGLEIKMWFIVVIKTKLHLQFLN